MFREFFSIFGKLRQKSAHATDDGNVGAFLCQGNIWNLAKQNEHAPDHLNGYIGAKSSYRTLRVREKGVEPQHNDSVLKTVERSNRGSFAFVGGGVYSRKGFSGGREKSGLQSGLQFWPGGSGIYLVRPASSRRSKTLSRASVRALESPCSSCPYTP